MSPQLQQILKGVSRSFYLTLRVLPNEVRQQIALAYLLARAADTLADTRVLEPGLRLMALQQFQQVVQQGMSAHGYSHEAGLPLQWIQQQLSGKLDNPDEQHLLQRLPELFQCLAQSQEQDRALICHVVMTLSSGMVFDLQTFPSEHSGDCYALPEQQQLQHYTYLVAGCVGEFWTEIGVANLCALQHWDSAHFSLLGVQFGQGLQMVNILRDLPQDLRIGRCYLPQSWLHQHALSREGLMDAGNAIAARPLLKQGIRLALTHFDAAEEYVLAIPTAARRFRLAALWPLLIGLATLAQLIQQADRWLDPAYRIKVKRGWIYRMMLRSVLCVSSHSHLQQWIASLKDDIWRELGVSGAKLPQCSS